MATGAKWDAKTWAIGVLTTVVMAQGSFLAKIAFNDLPHDTRAKIEIASQLNDLRSEVREMQFDNYAAWGYQLRVNQMILASIAIPTIEWPDIPAHLKAHP